MARVYFDERTNWWCMDYRDAQGHRKQIKAGRTKTLADAMLRKRLDETQKEVILGHKQMTKIKLSDFALGVYCEYMKTNLRSWYREQRRVRGIIKHFDNKFLNEITSQDIERFKQQRLSYSKPATANRDVVRLKNLFKMAIQWGYAVNNPARDVRLMPENNARLRYLTRAEYDRLLIFAPEELKPLITIAIYTGMRKGELTNIKWTDIDFEKGLITVPNTKNNQPRYIPMNSIVRDTINNVTKNLNSPYLFVSKYGTQYHGFDDTFRNVLKRAGISGVCWHTLRHSFASWLAEEGATPQELQNLLGHKTLNMVLRYAHLSPNCLKERVQKLVEKDQNTDRVATYVQHKQTALAVAN